MSNVQQGINLDPEILQATVGGLVLQVIAAQSAEKALRARIAELERQLTGLPPQPLAGGVQQVNGHAQVTGWAP